jgi:putative transposase
MCALFRNKYRIGSTRYRGYDYSSPGKYFITICTKDRKPYFGEVENGKMILSDLGIIAEKFWREIPGHFPNIDLDEYIIMPDHIHGILIINRDYFVEAPKLGASTIKLGASTIGSIINQFKRICTITIKSRGFDFAWQSRFHDHIIRTRIELYRIRKYIRENPEKLSRKKQKRPGRGRQDKRQSACRQAGSHKLRSGTTKSRKAGIKVLLGTWCWVLGDQDKRQKTKDKSVVTFLALPLRGSESA